ncbi:DNA-directed RNA polymeraseM/15kDa subunit [Penicillium desertorum]|uniref:DNA-directed RNA polymerase II subunit RPB9 n=1 Tax=Penicillium desertorum TaxID=1303715 RepID=A0A9X0BVR5_9EURO|nr:DNA-directed RNA polymeraseM/15kDa subunit [Penicillium desertorum]
MEAIKWLFLPSSSHCLLSLYSAFTHLRSMSASPSSTAGGDTKPSDQIHFKFCRECSNLLYPKEDRVNNQLMFTCRTCHVGEPASSHCVYQNHLHSQVGDTAGVTQDVTSDPTVCAPGFCTLCGDIVTCSICDPTPDEDLSEVAPPVGDSLESSELPRANKLCPSCGETEAVFFQSQQRSAETGMKLYYVCCACGQVYV